MYEFEDLVSALAARCCGKADSCGVTYGGKVKMHPGNVNPIAALRKSKSNQSEMETYFSEREQS